MITVGIWSFAITLFVISVYFGVGQAFIAAGTIILGTAAIVRFSELS